jgi:predicted membrane metal-binding protein
MGYIVIIVILMVLIGYYALVMQPTQALAPTEGFTNPLTVLTAGLFTSTNDQIRLNIAKVAQANGNYSTFEQLMGTTAVTNITPLRYVKLMNLYNTGKLTDANIAAIMTGS